MYSIIIVDDEKIIRSGLSCFIDWPAMGFEVVATFEDGDEAMEYLEHNKVDVVLTDIKMARVSGIELAKYIHENKSETQVVMISGYKDFEYARNAIEYNVVQYILKPVNSEELVKIFSEIRDGLDKKAEEVIDHQKEISSYQEMVPMLQQQFFADLLAGALVQQSDMKRRIDLLRLPFNHLEDQCWLLEAHLEDYDDFVKERWPYEKDRLQTALYNFFNIEDGEFYSYSIFNSKKDLDVTIVDCFGYGIDRGDVLRKIEEISESIEKVIGLKIVITEKGNFDSLHRLAQFNRPIWINRFAVEDKSDRLSYEDFDYCVVQEHFKNILSKIDECNCSEMNHILNRLFDEIGALPIRYIHHIVIELFALIVNRYTFARTNAWEYIREDAAYRKVVGMDNIKDISNYVKQTMRKLIEDREKEDEEGTVNVLDSAITYIHSNYKEDISREDVADHVYLNASYFSRFFKQQTGETFSDYLTSLRMEKAIELVKEGKYKAYVISEKVGYKNSKNFTRVFKKWTGCTPVEYARRYTRAKL